MPPVEAWAKVAVDAEFTDTLHGSVACTDCHGGTSTEYDMEAVRAVPRQPADDRRRGIALRA